MPSPEQDIKFLQAYLKKLQELYQILSELSYPQDFTPVPEDEVPVISPDAKRVARLADDNGFDDSLFRDLTGNIDPDPTSPSSMRYLRKKIQTIPRIIEKIEKSNKTEQKWHIENGQVFYDGTDLQFPSGQIQEVLKKLVDSEGKTVLYKELNDIASQEKYRHYIGDIRKRLKDKDIPYEIKTVTYEGYKLQKKARS